METTDIKLNKKTGQPLKTKGGARKGAGRPKGGTNQVSVNGLLAALENKTKGVSYETILMEDFISARNNNDQQLVLKYHNLILNKLMTHVSKIEITDSQETIDAKQQAFTEALAKLAGIKKE
jgi:hypothetical protein